MEHFRRSLHVVNPTGILGIGLRVKGKCDLQEVFLYLWANDTYPELCPVRHLLLYVFLTGIKGGLLFPNLRLPIGPNGVSNHKLSYETILDQFKRLHEIVAPLLPPALPDDVPDENADLINAEEDDVDRQRVKIGTHTGRKTGYIFGVWGKGTMADIMAAARHKSEKHAIVYRKEAATLYEIHIRQHGGFLSAENNVSKWESNFLVSEGLNARSINSTSCRFTGPIHVLAHRFVHGHMAIHPSNPYVQSVTFLSQQVLLYQRTNDSKEILRNYIKENCKEGAAAEVFALCNNVVIETLQEARTRNASVEATVAGAAALAATATDPPTLAIAFAAVAAAPPTAAVRRKRGGDWIYNAALMASLKAATTTLGKITAVLLLKASEPKTSDPTDPSTLLHEKSRSFMNHNLRRPIHCLTAHFGGNVDMFCASYPTIPFLSKFKCCAQCPPV
jgi:hypothetical protein